MRRIAILAEGLFGIHSSKTAVGVLRFSPDTVVAVIDLLPAGFVSVGSVAGAVYIPFLSMVPHVGSQESDSGFAD